MKKRLIGNYIKKSLCLSCKKKCKDKHCVSECSVYLYEFTVEDKRNAIRFAIGRVNYHRRLRGLPEEELDLVKIDLEFNIGRINNEETNKN